LVDGNSRTGAARWFRATSAWREEEIRHTDRGPAQYDCGTKGVFGCRQPPPGRDRLLDGADPPAGHQRDEPVADVLPVQQLDRSRLGHLVRDGDGGREPIDLEESESSFTIHRALS